MSFLLIGLVIFAIAYKIPKFMEYSNRIDLQKQENLKQFDNQVFNFLLKSGKQRLQRYNLTGAYSEFKLAYNIKPENQELNDLMLQTLSILCDHNNKYCDDLDVLLSN